jgi:hypothetical protein
MKKKEKNEEKKERKEDKDSFFIWIDPIVEEEIDRLSKEWKKFFE